MQTAYGITRNLQESSELDKDGDSMMIDADEQTVGATEKEISNYSIPLNLRESCVSFLIRYVCASDHRASDNELGIRSLNILSVLLSEKYWPNVNIKMAYFEKFLANIELGSENTIYYCINTLDVLYIFFNNKKPEWIVANLTTIQSLLDKCIEANHHDMQEALQKVLNVVLKAIKVNEETVTGMNDSSPSKIFIKYLESIITQDLQGTSSVAAGVTLVWTCLLYTSRCV